MKFLITALLFVSVAIADEMLKLDAKTFRTKLQELMSKDGPVSFDDTISHEMAQNIYKKYMNHEPFRSTNNNNNNINNNNKTNDKRLMLGSDGSYEDADKQTTLDSHNDYRNILAGGQQTDDGTDGKYPTSSDMNELAWDPAIAAVAQAYADTCNWGHNGNRNTEFFDYKSQATFEYGSSIYLGENIAAMWTSSKTIKDTYLTDRIDAWWNEYNLWHYQAYQSSSINGAGHFTQMAWANTRYLGCGFSVCPDGSTNMYYLVCNYYPGGNYLSQYPYTTGSTCSKCDADRTDNCNAADWNSLCGGCMDPNFDLTGSTSDSSECCDGLDRSAADRDTGCSSSGGSSDSGNSDSGSSSGGNSDSGSSNNTPSPTESSSLPECNGNCAEWSADLGVTSTSTVICNSNTIVDCIVEGLVGSYSYSRVSYKCNSNTDIELYFSDVVFPSQSDYLSFSDYWTSNGNNVIAQKAVSNCNIDDLTVSVIKNELTICQSCSSIAPSGTNAGNLHNISVFSMVLVAIVTFIKLLF